MLPLGDTAPSGYRQTKAAAEAVCERHFESHGVPSAPLQLGDIGMATAACSVDPPRSSLGVVRVDRCWLAHQAAGSVIPDDDAFVIVLKASRVPESARECPRFLPDDAVVIVLKACVALGLFPDVPWASSLMAVDQCASLFVRLLVDAPAGEFSGRPSEVNTS